MNERIIVVYQSIYGSTKTYAEWIAQALDARMALANEIKPGELGNYDVVVYGGGLYAGTIVGEKLAAQVACRNLVIFTVGLYDPAITDYSPITDRLSAELGIKARFFHLRGGVDYKRLGLLHKAMMSINKRVILKKPASELTGEDKFFLETYGGQIDFCDKDSIKPLVDYVQSIL